MDEPDRKRLANWAAAVVVAALLILGVWMMGVLSDAKRSQDCLASGSRHCRIIQPN